MVFVAYYIPDDSAYSNRPFLVDIDRHHGDRWYHIYGFAQQAAEISVWILCAVLLSVQRIWHCVWQRC